MRQTHCFILFIFFGITCLALNDPYLSNLEEKIDKNSAQWFMNVLKKRTQLDSENKFKTDINWYSEFEKLLLTLHERKKLSSEQLQNLWVDSFKNCLKKTNSDLNQICISQLLPNFRNLWGATEYEQKILLLKNEFLTLIERENKADSPAFSTLFDACLYATDIDCLSRLKLIISINENVQKNDDLILLTLIEWKLNQKALSDTYLSRLIAAHEKDNQNNDFTIVSSVYLMRDQCKEGLDYLSKKPQTNDKTPIKTQLNLLLIELELLRICRINKPTYGELRKIISRIDKKSTYLRLKAVTELIIWLSNSEDSSVLSEMKSEIIDIESKMIAPYVPRLALSKALLAESQEQRKEVLDNLVNKLELQNDSESQYVKTAIKTMPSYLIKESSKVSK